MRKTKIFSVWFLFAAMILTLLPFRANAATNYTVRFREQDGTLITSKTVAKNKTITLPSIPSKTDQKNVGWCTSKGKTSPVKSEGYSMKVTKNITFYAVRKNNYLTLSYYSNDGKRKIKDVKVYDGKIKLMSERNPAGYNFMGWSTAKGQKVKPKYEALETISIKKNMKLYEVLYKTSSETKTTAKTFKSTSRYDEIIFLGDKRVLTMDLSIPSNKYRNIKFLPYFEAGFGWTNNGSSLAIVQQEMLNHKSSKKIAVVFNHGLYDAPTSGMANFYADKYNEIAKMLVSNGCDVFYMSINPVNSGMTSKVKEDQIRDFNSILKSKLKGFRWIDSYEYLNKTGYVTNDGLDYSKYTHIKIYNYCLSQISKVK